MRLAPLALAGLAACSWVDPDPAWADRKAQVVEADAFVASARELDGIDPPQPADRVEKGDRILYGIEFEKNGATRNWLVNVEVEDARFDPRRHRDGMTHFMLQLAVRVSDEGGAEVGRDLVVVSRDDLVFGLYRACQEAERPPERESATEPPVEPQGESEPEAELAGDDGSRIPFSTRVPTDVSAGLALANMLAVVRESKVLFDVLWTVIDKPSIFSVIVNLGVRVSIHERFEDARQVAPIAIDGQEFPVYELPVELRLNDVPALRAVLLVTEPGSPLNLSAGILGVDAFQPSDPTARVSMRVLAARRS